MAKQSMIHIEETEDQLKRILMFFNIDFSDRLNYPWDCIAKRRNLGGGVKKISSFGEPNKFYSNFNNINEFNRRSISHIEEQQHQHQYDHYMNHKKQRDNIDYLNRIRHFQYRPHRQRPVQPQPPINGLNYDYGNESYGTDRAYKRQRYQLETEAERGEPEYPEVVRAYPPQVPHSTYERDYDYYPHMARPAKRPPPSPLPIEYYPYGEPPQREYKYTPRKYLHEEPPVVYPPPPRKIYRQVSGSIPTEYPPICQHDDYTTDISRDYNYNKYTKRQKEHGSSNRYKECDCYDERTQDYDYHQTPLVHVPSVSFSREKICYDKKKSNPFPPEPIPNKYNYYIRRDPETEHRESRPKPQRPPKPTLPKECRKVCCCCRKKAKYPLLPKDSEELMYLKSHKMKSPIRRKSLEIRGKAGIDVDIEIPHKILKESKASLAKRNRCSIDKTEGQSYVRFLGVDIPYKTERECFTQPEKRYDSGCDCWQYNSLCFPEIPRSNVNYRDGWQYNSVIPRTNFNHVSVACQGSQLSVPSSRKSSKAKRRTRSKSLKQRISGFLRKSKLCLKRSKRKLFKRENTNAETQCSDWGNNSTLKLNRSSRNCLENVNRSASRLTVPNKWHNKKQEKKSIFLVNSNSRTRVNAYRRCQPSYPTMYRDKSNYGLFKSKKNNYQHYSMVNYESPSPSNRGKYPLSKCKPCFDDLIEDNEKENDDSTCGLLKSKRNNYQHYSMANYESPNSSNRGNHPLYKYKTCFDDLNEDNEKENDISISCDYMHCRSKLNNLRNDESPEFSRSPTATCTASNSQSSIDLNEPTKINLCLTIRAKDINLVASSTKDCRCIVETEKTCQSGAGSPSTVTLRCRKNTLANEKRTQMNSQEISPTVNPSKCSLSLSECASQASVMSRPRLLSPANSSSGLSNSNSNKSILKQRNPNDPMPRPTKKVSLNTNYDQMSYARQQSQKSCIKKYPSAESLQRICNRNSLPNRYSSETAIHSQRSFNGNKRTICYSPGTVSDGNAIHKNSNPSCSKRNLKLQFANCNDNEDLSCPRHETEEKSCLPRRPIEELKEELLQNLKRQSMPSISSMPQVISLPCLPDSVTYPVYDSSTNFSQMNRPI